jgi:hypothetical protein
MQPGGRRDAAPHPGPVLLLINLKTTKSLGIEIPATFSPARTR